jgi:hypothetical protein
MLWHALSRWGGLTRLLDDGRIEIDSEVVERSIRSPDLDGGGVHWACRHLAHRGLCSAPSLALGKRLPALGRAGRRDFGRTHSQLGQRTPPPDRAAYRYRSEHDAAGRLIPTMSNNRLGSTIPGSTPPTSTRGTRRNHRELAPSALTRYNQDHQVLPLPHTPPGTWMSGCRFDQ